MKKYILLILFLLPVVVLHGAQEKSHPCLMLTATSVKEIRKSLHRYPLFSASVGEMENAVKPVLGRPIDVPFPADAGGGYTHERHKLNAHEMYQAGLLYQVLQREEYAEFVRAMLLKYSALYPRLPIHAKRKDQGPGKLFWQNLNESVWLVYAIQAYDCIYDFLAADERKTLEENLFLPVASFLSKESPETFNRIHNHGTWAVAAVGMTGYVLGNKHLSDIALTGLQKDGKAGFLRQLDELFSPDGYYTEGPYYQRYALMPFVLFALAVDNNNPEASIFSYRHRILEKAIHTTLQLTSSKGRFIPFNDAVKEKNWLTNEMVFAVDIGYARYGNPSFTGVARRQGKVMVSAEGLKVARAIAEDRSADFRWESINLTDGPDGKQGGVTIMRGNNPAGLMAVFKYASQGMGHGHFDRLSLMVYDNGEEVLQDYGAARFVNVEPKYGGHYLPENASWAKQSVAHNTLVVDGSSHFGGDYSKSSQSAPSRLYSNLKNERFQITTSQEKNAYPGTVFTRGVAMFSDAAFEHPLILDVMHVSSEEAHRYDLPFYYQGQLISTNYEMETFHEAMKPAGEGNGYQHLWLTGVNKTVPAFLQVTWLNGERFYSLSTVAVSDMQILHTRIGANDPRYNLRNEPGLIIRRPRAKSATFFTIIEPHGEYDTVNELTRGFYSSINDLEVVAASAYAVVVRFGTQGKKWQLSLSLQESGNEKVMTVESEKGSYSFTGPYELKQL